MNEPENLFNQNENDPQKVEREMQKIDSLISDLKEFENDNPTHPDVETALEIVKDTMSPHKHSFIKGNVLVAYHGSLQYNDPRNLDVDLTFVTLHAGAASRNFDLVDQLTNEFEDISDWPEMGNNQGHCHTNFNRYSLSQIEEEVSEFVDRPFDRDDDFSDLFVSCILTSKILFPEQEELMNMFQETVRKILTGSMVLRNAVINNLQDTIDIRRERQPKNRSN